MSWQVKSIQVGMPRERSNGQKTWRTGIFKTPVQSPVQATATGLAGDGVGDTKHHGGPDKAICCHPWAHYDYWNAYFLWNLEPGVFGENFTLLGLTESDVAVGDVWQVGAIRVQVSQPRIPCWQQSDKLGQPGFEKLVMQTGKSGFYLRVLEPGMVAPGDTITLVERPHPAASIVRLNRALAQPQDIALTEEFAELPPLSDDWRAMFAERLAKHRAGATDAV